MLEIDQKASGDLSFCVPVNYGCEYMFFSIAYTIMPKGWVNKYEIKMSTRIRESVWESVGLVPKGEIVDGITKAFAYTAYVYDLLEHTKEQPITFQEWLDGQKTTEETTVAEG